MLPLIQTLFDIALLRKGPDSVPRSGVLLLMSLVLWTAAMTSYNIVLGDTEPASIQRELFAFILGIACYYAVLSYVRKPARAMQLFTAMFGCGALLLAFFIAAMATAGQLLGNAVVFLIFMSYLIWSISVEGHIIATAIDRALYVGVIIAFAVFVIQVGAVEFLMPGQAGS